VFVHGIGKRKTPLQKSIETLEDYLCRLKNTIIRYISVENATVIPRQTMMPPLCG
jgi:hypothetical protein